MRDKSNLAPCKKTFFYKNSDAHQTFLVFFIVSIFFCFFFFYTEKLTGSEAEREIRNFLLSIFTGYIVTYFFYYLTIYHEKKSLNKEMVHYIFFTIELLEGLRGGVEEKDYYLLKKHVQSMINISSANPIYVRLFLSNFSLSIPRDIEQFKKEYVPFCSYGLTLFHDFLEVFPDSYDLRADVKAMKKHVKSYR